MGIQQLQQQLELFRLACADRPFWLFAAVLFIFLCLLTLIRGRTRDDAGPREGSAMSAATVAAVLTIATYVAIVLWYLWQEPYYDYAEPTIAAVGWLFELGRPIYHGVDAAERYSHVYGPLAFIIPGSVLAVAGPSILTSKIAGAAAGLLGLGLVYRLARSATGRRRALLLTGLFAMAGLMYRNLSFWLRPDSFLLLFTSCALLAATRQRKWLAAIGVGVGAGVLVNLKITGLFYALPAFGLLMARFGGPSVATAAVTAMLTALLPFAAFDNVSLVHYLQWIRMSAGNGLWLTTLRQNTEWALFLLVPLAPTLLVSPPPSLPRGGRRWLYGTFLLGLAGVVVSASKPGAAPYHLMPFWPIVVYAMALHVDAVEVSLRTDRFYRAGRLAFPIVIFSIAFVQQVYFLSTMKKMDGVEGKADLEQFVRANPRRSIGMGYAHQDERLTWVRPVLVFRTGQYLIDAPAVQEYQMSGLGFPARTEEAVRRCAVDLWLFPRHAKPFDGPNAYPTTGYAPLFPEHFKQVFFEHYEHARDTRYFQVWRCRQPAAS
jgi:hypothetical protein